MLGANVGAGVSESLGMTLCSHLLVGILLLTPLDRKDNVVSASQQYFRVRPQDTQVAEGQTAELQCHIGNLAGPVQWSKDGFVLGFDPDIPGYPRYTMVVDAQRGVYNLRLRDVQLEDEADYQCQVGPAQKNHAIWSSSHLTVLVPAKKIELRHRGTGNVVEVREAEHVTLACWVRNTKPVSVIKWFRNGIPLQKEKVQSKEDSSGDKLHSVYTSVTLYPKLDDNRALYSCEAHHPALTTPLRGSVTVSVLYPPGPPEIEGYQAGDIVQVGDTLTLACISRGGNPPASLTWRKDGAALQFNYKNGSREVTSTYTFVVTASDNNAVYRCEAANVVTPQAFESSVTLSVLFAPSRVTITGPKEARAGEMVTMTCTTSASNPAVGVSWEVDGRLVEPASAQATALTRAGWVTSSNLTITLTRQDPDTKMFTCVAESLRLQETVIQTAMLNIVYPPKPPVIIGYEEGTPIMAQAIQRIKCVSIGGNPLPTLKWYKGEKEYSSLSTVTGSGVSSVLEIMAQPEDNQAIYSCKASNSATDKPLTTSIKTTVLYPPQSTSISLIPQAPREGSTVVLTCETSSSNPESRIRWMRNAVPIASQHQSHIESRYGGKATRSRIRFNVTAADDGSVFTCRASNDIQKEAQETVTLRVLHKPLFLHPPIEKYEVLQGQNALLNVSARANPAVISYMWTKDGVPLPGPDHNYPWQDSPGHAIFYRGPVLHIYEADKADSGDYECEASNAEGNTKTTVIVRVLYPATITKITKYAMVGVGENASFECVVDANPLIEDAVRWRGRGFDLRHRTRVVHEKGRSSLTVYNVREQDKGTFECVAHNGIGDEAVRSTLLIVKFKPVIQSPREELTIVAADVGRTLRLGCSAVGAPKVTFIWTLGDSVIAETEAVGRRHAIRNQRLEAFSWESALVVKYVHAQDYGRYTCISRNDLGYDTARFLVRPRGKPDLPDNVRPLNTTHTGVLLTWNSGFNGGLEQQFRIRFRRVEDTAFGYTDLIPGDVTLFMVSGLEPGTGYVFSVMGCNALGESDYSAESEVVTTLSRWVEQDSSSAVIDALSGRQEDVPRLLLVTVAVVGIMLLLVNALLVVCFVRRRERRQPPQIAGSEKESKDSEADSQMYTSSKYHETINGQALRPLREGTFTTNVSNSREDVAIQEVPEDLGKNIKSYQVLETFFNKGIVPREGNCQPSHNSPDVLKTKKDGETDLNSGRQMIISTSFPSKDVLFSIDSRYPLCPVPSTQNDTLGRVSTTMGRYMPQESTILGCGYGATLSYCGTTELSMHAPTSTADVVHAPASCIVGKVGSHMV